MAGKKQIPTIRVHLHSVGWSPGRLFSCKIKGEKGEARVEKKHGDIYARVGLNILYYRKSRA